MLKILSKTLDLFCFIVCIVILLHDAVMLIRGWQLTWFGILTLFMCCLYLEIVYEENKKVLKAIIQKALRVLCVNKKFTNRLYHKSEQKANLRR